MVMSIVNRNTTKNSTWMNQEQEVVECHLTKQGDPTSWMMMCQLRLGLGGHIIGVWPDQGLSSLGQVRIPQTRVLLPQEATIDTPSIGLLLKHQDHLQVVWFGPPQVCWEILVSTRRKHQDMNSNHLSPCFRPRLFEWNEWMKMIWKWLGLVAYMIMVKGRVNFGVWH